MKKRSLALVIVALLVIMSALPALAESGEIVLTGGTMSVLADDIEFTGYTLDGLAHDDVAGTTGEWTATDPRGVGTGWNLTIAATVPTNGDSKTIAITGFEMLLESDDIDCAVVEDTCEGTNAPPTTEFGTAKALTVAAQPMVSAASGAGMGSYTLQPSFTLDVPADVYAGTYVSTITLEMVAGPAS